MVQAYLEVVAAKSSPPPPDLTQPSASHRPFTCKHCDGSAITCSCYTGYFVTSLHQPPTPTEEQLHNLIYFNDSTLPAEETAVE